MLLTEKAAASVAATAVITTSSSPSTTAAAAATTDPMTNALELQLQNEERREEEGQDHQIRQEGQDQGRKLAISKAFICKS